LPFVPSVPSYGLSSVQWNSFCTVFSAKPTFLQVVGDVGDVMRNLNLEILRTNDLVLQDGNYAVLHLYPLCLRLLIFSFNYNEDIDVMLEATRLAIMLYLFTIREAFNIQPFCSKVQTVKLRELLERHMSLNWGLVEWLRLWVQSMCAIESGRKDRQA
jgi:hypothetical protein